MRTLLGATLAALAFGGAAYANPPLPNLTNLDFTSYSGTAPKGSFNSVDPVGWTGGSGLIFIDSPASFNTSAAGPVYLTTYGNPKGSVPGNYVEADGNPTFESGFNYTVTGLTPGQTYTLSFYQGASQQVGFSGTTTNQWIVGLGGTGFSVCDGCGAYDSTFNSNQSTYSDPGASIAASPLMTVATGQTVGWNYVSVNLTANASTELLSFLAWGDDGTTNNLPPIAFLAGVNSPPGLGTPEPASWALMILGVAAVGGAARLRRSRNVGISYA